MCLIFRMEILSRTRANDVQFVQRAELRVLGCNGMQSLVAVGVWGDLIVILEKWCWTTSGQLFGVLDKIWTNFRGFGQLLDNFLWVWTKVLYNRRNTTEGFFVKFAQGGFFGGSWVLLFRYTYGILELLN